MSILLAILTALGSAASAVATLLKPLAPYLVLVGVGCLLGVMLVYDGCGCRRSRPPRSPRMLLFGVESVESGATILVKTGLRDRRSAAVVLADIEVPPEVAQQARANLERLAGGQIRVEISRGRLFGAAADDEGLEARGPIVGVVYGEGGTLLNLAQIEAGWARCLPDAPEEWKAAESRAAKLHCTPHAPREGGENASFDQNQPHAEREEYMKAEHKEQLQ